MRLRAAATAMTLSRLITRSAIDGANCAAMLDAPFASPSLRARDDQLDTDVEKQHGPTSFNTATAAIDSDDREHDAHHDPAPLPHRIAASAAWAAANARRAR